MVRIWLVLWPCLLSILSGVLLALCFAPFQSVAFVWLAPIMLLSALWFPRPEVKKKRKAFGIAWVGGFVFWAINLKWLATVTGPAYLILAAYLALFFAIFGVFAATIGNPFRVKKRNEERALRAPLRSLAYAVLNAGLWCGLEWVRGWLLTGFGWNGLGVAFREHLPLAQMAEFVGVSGLAFLPVFIAAVLVQIGDRLAKGVSFGRIQRHWDFIIAMLVMITWILFGGYRAQFINRLPSDTLQVLLVQQNIPQEAGRVLWTGAQVHAAFESETRKAFEELEVRNNQLIKEATGEVELESIDWVVWPEVVLYGPLLSVENEDEDYALYEPSSSTIQRMRELGVKSFLAGIWEVEAAEIDGQIQPKPSAKQYNALLAVNPQAEIATHRKQHLVLYGEFIPFVDSVKWLADIYKMVAGVEWGGNLGRGTGSEGFVLPAQGGDVSVIPSICFEDTVPRVTRKFSKKPREVIVNLTNDGWFGESAGSQQHFDNALFRTIELRRPMLRAANRGITGVVSATGSSVDYESYALQSLLDESGSPFTAGSILAKVRITSHLEPTLYAKYGDRFSIGGLILAGVCCIRSFFRKN